MIGIDVKIYKLDAHSENEINLFGCRADCYVHNFIDSPLYIQFDVLNYWPKRCGNTFDKDD